MKRLLVRLLFATAATEAGAGSNAVETPKPLTSEKLVELQKQYADAWSKMIQIKNPLSAEAKDAKLAVYKIEGEMKAEEQALVKAENERKLQEQRNERLALNTKQLELHTALVTMRADKKADAAKLAELENEFNTAKEAVDNELLAKYAASSTARKKTSTGEKTERNTEQKDAIIELYLAGKTQKEIEEQGFKRSTVWHTINNYKKANGLS